MDSNHGDGVCATSGGLCTLRAAIQEANAFPGTDTVDLPSGTYMLTITGTGEDLAATGDLDITQPMTLQGTDLDTDGVPEWTQSLVSVDTSGGSVSGVDFGFNFDVVVNTNDGGQGSLRQFILNSNLLQ